jgi:hypothetical protein
VSDDARFYNNRLPSLKAYKDIASTPFDDLTQLQHQQISEGGNLGILLSLAEEIIPPNRELMNRIAEIAIDRQTTAAQRESPRAVGRHRYYTILSKNAIHALSLESIH